jgi:two-component system OmpR family sensor kinase
VALLGLVALVCVVVGVATDVALERYQLRQLDIDLLAAGGRATGGGAPVAMTSTRCAASSPAPSVARGIGFLQAPGQATGTLAAELTRNKVTAAAYLDAAGCTRSLSAAEESTLTGIVAGGSPRTRQIGGLGQYRLVGTADGAGDVLVTGLPLAAVTATQRRLAEVEVGVSAVAVVAAGLAATAIVRRSLRPLRRVATTAARVSALPLDRGEVVLAIRVPDADTDPRTEVGQVGGALNRLLGHVGSALTARHDSEMRVRRFVADASHELRTPLAAIRGYAELTNRRAEDLPPDAAHAMGRIQSEAERMTVLVEDLLLLARLDSGRPLVQEPVDLSRLVIDAVSDSSAAGRDHDWRIDLPDEPVVVRGDPDRLHQVVANLLTNGRTHTPPGTRITTSVVRAGPEDVVLAVVDDGPGIPAELAPHVFERFARGDSSRSRAGGSTGLGLAIVSAIVVAHGGKVELSSRPGRTAFGVRLPALVEDSLMPVQPSPTAVTHSEGTDGA